jgi:predicted nuclease of predicted toxin-antitoxin system
VRFLADESCDFGVVTALRAAGHDLTAIAETNASADDEVVLSKARAEARTLITEDKDFGLLAYATVKETAGVVLIRYPANARRNLGRDIVAFVAAGSEPIAGAFVVLEPGRARVSRPNQPQR